MDQDDFGILSVDIECDIEEPEVELLRQRLKELELSLESETIRRKRVEAALEAKRFSENNLAQDPKIFKFYTGSTEEQFYCLLDFLGDGMNNLAYWGSSSASNSNSGDLGCVHTWCPGTSARERAQNSALSTLWVPKL